jgi:ribose transport system permease protein
MNRTGLSTRSLPHPIQRTMGRMGHAALTYIGVGGALLLLVVYLSLTQDQFLTYQNWMNILETNAILLTAAVGLTFVLLVGGFDLSIGGTLALAGVALAALITAGVPILLAMVLVVLAAAAWSLAVNGMLISHLGLSFLVVTLGSAALFRGIALLWTGGLSQPLFAHEFLVNMGSGRVAGIPILVIIALTAFTLAILVVRYTGYGRMLYATGGNQEAARLAGINTVWVRASVYGIAGAFAGLAGLMDAARLATAAPDAQLGIELTETQVGGGSDAQFAAAVGTPVLDGLGGVGEGPHADHEYVTVAELPRRVALLASVLVGQ